MMLYALAHSAKLKYKHMFTLNGCGYDGHNQTNEAIKLALQH